MENKEIKLSKFEKISLDNCDKEPVHIPGQIQDMAVLIATAPNLNKITYCSDNTESIFGIAAKNLLGKPLSHILDPNVLHDLNNTLSLSSARLHRERVKGLTLNQQKIELWAHINKDIPILEFEPIETEVLTPSQSILNVRSLLARLGSLSDMEKSLKVAVTGLRHLSGYDRVLAYKFDVNGDGEVVAEARGPKLESFLGLRFPKWDIPNQAREIMKVLPLRMISDINGKPIPLLADKSVHTELDLTFATSRGVSPVHMEYLRNMGVGGTMTLSIVVKGALWGLFAFHHESPRNIGPGLRGAAELFTQFFSLQMEQRLETELNVIKTHALEYQQALLGGTQNALGLTELVKELSEPLQNLIGAHGLALVSDDDISLYGNTPPAKMVREIAQTLFENTSDDIISTDSLKAQGHNTDTISGALALKLDEDTHNICIFFRDDADISINWAGAPDKDIVEDGQTTRLKPRSSFKAYQASIKAKSLPWSHKDIFAAQQIHIGLLKADTALFRRLTHKTERQRSIYIAELNHRVRNILSLIRSLSRRTHETSYSLESYAKALEHRIAALGAAHDLAANQIINGIVINELFALEAKPFENEDKSNILIKGEKYILRSDTAPVFALIVHELMTNCVKHGALSVPKGRVEVIIDKGDKGINITWSESGGPKTSQPSSHGFGMELIENAVPYELNGRSQIKFRPDGFWAKFWLPMKLIQPFNKAFQTPPKSRTRRPKKDNMPENVMIVEDSLMLAIDISDMLESFGIKAVKKCASVSQAKSLLSSYLPDFAVLDINLKDEQSFEIAEILLRKNVPFCFATGFGSEYPIPDPLKTQMVLTKPLNANILRDTIKNLYA